VRVLMKPTMMRKLSVVVYIVAKFLARIHDDAGLVGWTSLLAQIVHDDALTFGRNPIAACAVSPDESARH
jgi:hypothetical protein